MRRVVQVRGTTGSGKTTAMRGAIAIAGGGETRLVNGLRGNRGITVTSQFTVLGDYNNKAACVGCDRFDGREDLVAVLKSVLSEQPDRVAFEGMIYSHTFKLAADIARYCESIGYEFRCVFLNVDYDTALSRIFERNNAKPIKYDQLMEKIVRFRVSQEKIIRAGIDSVSLDAVNMTREQVAQAVYDAVVL